MDPQQKLLLQCAYRALEDAGTAMESISGSRTGVYIGALISPCGTFQTHCCLFPFQLLLFVFFPFIVPGLMNRDYEKLQSSSSATVTHYSGTGTAMSMAANRISFTFHLTGPSFAVDSACSSSLVALHTACQAIKQGAHFSLDQCVLSKMFQSSFLRPFQPGDCEMALCGGVSCIIEPRVFVALSKAKMISPEGTSKPFSSRADGYGRGEGCGVVLLKPLEKVAQFCRSYF